MKGRSRTSRLKFIQKRGTFEESHQSSIRHRKAKIIPEVSVRSSRGSWLSSFILVQKTPWRWEKSEISSTFPGCMSKSGAEMPSLGVFEHNSGAQKETVSEKSGQKGDDGGKSDGGGPMGLYMVLVLIIFCLFTIFTYLLYVHVNQLADIAVFRENLRSDVAVAEIQEIAREILRKELQEQKYWNELNEHERSHQDEPRVRNERKLSRERRSTNLMAENVVFGNPGEPAGPEVEFFNPKLKHELEKKDTEIMKKTGLKGAAPGGDSWPMVRNERKLSRERRSTNLMAENVVFGNPGEPAGPEVEFFNPKLKHELEKKDTEIMKKTGLKGAAPGGDSWVWLTSYSRIP
uniref:Uncharacterized protein n=1 Tax=Lutzomyia longipalpis TaxID=7200 RepID=A0A1B0CN99_LUTLO